MNVKSLIEMLSKANQEDIVKIYDPESKKDEEVTGMTYGGKDCIVILYSDEP